jgi:glycosyltransferase involved in cell wall biosynthesis
MRAPPHGAYVADPRLCMIVHGDYPDDVRVAREVRAARAAGFLVEVVATRGPGDTPHETIGGATVHRLSVSRKRGAGAIRFVVEYVLFTLFATVYVARIALRRRPDIVQVHNPPDFLIAAALLPKLLGARLIFDVHDLSSDMFAMRFGDRPGLKLADAILRFVERAACRLADAVVTVHEPYRAELGRRGVDVQQVLVVLNSVDEAVLPAEPRAPSRDPFRIVYHGTVTPHYGLHLVLDAFALLSEPLSAATLEIFGNGDAVSALQSRADSLGLGPRVAVNGVTLPQAEVLRLVQGASVGVIPNLPSKLNRFALSTKLFEYVALGIPVVAADLPTLRSHFSDAEILFFDAGSAESLAETLASVADDYDAALERARAAKARYHAAYEWRLQADKYAALLTSLANNSGSGRRSG